MTITLNSKSYEDHDDCLAAAASDVASEYGLPAWRVDADWGDEDRETIVVTLPDDVDARRGCFVADAS
jgi:hypothetical protein